MVHSAGRIHIYMAKVVAVQYSQRNVVVTVQLGTETMAAHVAVILKLIIKDFMEGVWEK